MPEIAVQDQNSLVVNGKTYSLSIEPSYQDELVQEEIKSILGQLSLKNITENLDLSVELFYVAYNGVAGARGGTIQAEIATLQSQLAELCNKCILTMTNFESETKYIIKELLQTYRWLMKGKESMAIKKLANCSKSSMSMSSSAKKLAESFKELQVKSTTARSNTIEEETSERDRKLAAEEAERKMIAKQIAEQTKQEELVNQISDVQQHYNEAKEKESKESDKALILGITSAIVSTIGAGLGAYAAIKNPIGTTAAKVNSSSGTDSKKIADAQKNANEKKKQSDEAQQKLLKAKDEQTAKQKTVDKLNSEIKELTKKITEQEQDSSAEEEKLKKLKEQREAKQTELSTADQKLTATNNKVSTLKKSAQDATAAYGAAGIALQNLSKNTSKMAEAAATAEESIHQEKMKLLNQKLELEKEKRQSLVALAEYAENIKNFKVEEGMATISVNSLHAAVDALGKIIGTLTNAGLFWDQMSAYCKRMTEQGFQQDIRDISDPDSGLSLEERIEEYRDPYFMGQFLGYMCQWVAVNGLSREYLMSANEAQKKAVKYLNQSPTIEEAMKKAPELAKNLELIVGQSLRESRQASADMEQQKALIDKKR